MRFIVKKKIAPKRSKGYRLKISTHKLIDKMQTMLECSQDEVVTKACIMYYKSLKNERSI